MPKQLKFPTGWHDGLSDEALVRMDQIIPGPNNPSPLVNASQSTWWRWVSDDLVPQPVRPSPGVTLWNVGQLRQWAKDPAGYAKQIRGSRRGGKK